MSYRRKHIRTKIVKSTPKIPFYRRTWFWLTLLIITVVSAVVYVLFFCSLLQVNKIFISGNNSVDSETVKNIIAENSSIKLFDFLGFSINTKSIFIINKENLVKIIQKTFPEIADINIRKKFPDSLSVQIEERKESAVLCGGQARDKCYMIDASGIIFRQVEAPIQDAVVIYQVNSNILASLGDKALDPELIEAVSSIKNGLLNNLQLSLKKTYIFSPTKLLAITDKKWEIYFDPGYDLDSQILKLNFLIRDMDNQQMDSLKYVDLRHADRAVICDNTECANNALLIDK